MRERKQWAAPLGRLGEAGALCSAKPDRILCSVGWLEAKSTTSGE